MGAKSSSSRIKAVHRKRKADTRARVMGAIRLLEEKGEQITFASMADTAGVTQATLYNHSDLKAMIADKRAEQHSARRRYGSAIAELNIAELKTENRRLRKKVESQRSWIEVLNDTGPVMRDEDLVSKLR